VSTRRFLSRSEARAVYDRMGRAQDTQAVYERPAVDALIARAALEHAETLFEVGCGTGRVAARCLRAHCPPETRYRGVDLSPTIVEIARTRLRPFGARAEVRRSDGGFSFDVPPVSQDRVLATYLVDLLPPADIHRFLAAAHRLLRPTGRLCLAGLGWGTRPVGRLVARAWDAVHRVRPAWVGGCRPLDMGPFLDGDRWRVVHRSSVQAWGVPSAVVVATPR
jgi:SAM-dependent methyltransferase